MAAEMTAAPETQRAAADYTPLYVLFLDFIR